MNVKKDLARRIVTDFHSADAAAKAGEDWGKQFQKDETPEDLEEVQVSFEAVKGKDGGIRLDKLIPLIGMAQSASEANRKIKEGAVRVNGEVVKENNLQRGSSAESKTPFTVRVGRKIKKVCIVLV